MYVKRWVRCRLSELMELLQKEPLEMYMDKGASVLLDDLLLYQRFLILILTLHLTNMVTLLTTHQHLTCVLHLTLYIIWREPHRNQYSVKDIIHVISISIKINSSIAQLPQPKCTTSTDCPQQMTI